MTTSNKAKSFPKELLIAGGLLVVVLIGGLIFSQFAAPPPVKTNPLPADAHTWTPDEKRILASLWLENLPPLPPDLSNAVADDEAAAKLGQHFFFDTRFSSNGEVACATCHQPDLMFTDGLPRAQGVGETTRKTMTIIGVAYSPWLFWDGRKDSQWSQALGPTESAVEHGGNRSQYAHLIGEDEAYRQAYEAIFGPFPDLSDESRFPKSAGPVEDSSARGAWEGMASADQEIINQVFVNMGKAIAAYERLIMPGPARFDTYIKATLAGDETKMRETLTEEEAYGLHLFIGEAQCIQCHNGPLLTNHAFHNTGVPPTRDLPPDPGRIEGVLQALDDPFNCLGIYSDADPQDCAHLRFAKTEGDDLPAAFKTPTLRNVDQTAPYMHAGQIATLDEVLHHYNRAELAFMGHSELSPLYLTPAELGYLEAFLHTLSAPLATPAEFLVAPEE